MSALVKAVVVFAFIILLGAVILALPDSPLPSNIASAVAYVASTASWANRYLPIDTLVQLFIYGLTIEVTIWVIRNFQRILTYASRIFS